MKKILVPLVVVLIYGTSKLHAQADPSAGNTKTAVIKYLDDFGANALDTLDDSKALQDAAKWFDQYNGHVNYNTQYGVLKLKQGTYLVGKQHLDVNDPSTFGTVMYQALFQNLDGLIVEGATDQAGNNLTKIKIAANGYFGYFNKSDLTLNTPLYGADPNNSAVQNTQAIGIGTGAIFLLAGSAKNMLIRNIEMDGNADSYNVGYPWISNGDFNCFSYAINTSWTRYLSLENLYIHNFGEDGILLELDHYFRAAPGRWNVTIDNVKSYWNGRQAFSWVGGSDLRVQNSEFSYTRLKDGTFSTRSQTAGSPGCNVDIEPNNVDENGTEVLGKIRNGLFNNCKMLGNIGASTSLAIQLDSDSLIFNNCEIKCYNEVNPNNLESFSSIGFQSAIRRTYTFNNCDIIGCIDFIRRNFYFYQWLLPDSGYSTFNNCLITQPNSSSYLNDYPLLATYDREIFNNCTIKKINQRNLFEGFNKPPIPNGNAILPASNYTTLNNCNIISIYNSEGQTNVLDFRGRIYNLRFTGNTNWSHNVSTNYFEGQKIFFQNATLNGSDMYSPMNTFTFPNVNVFEGQSPGNFTVQPNYDIHAYQRPIIIGETPCEYLQVYLGENNIVGGSIFRNGGRPVYIGEGATLTVRSGSSLILSGNIYLAGKIIIDSGAVLMYTDEVAGVGYPVATAPTIHLLGAADIFNINSHIIFLRQGATATINPIPFLWTRGDNGLVSGSKFILPLFVSHSLRSELMAPNEYLRSEAAADRFTYDASNAKCVQCAEIAGSSNLDCNSFTLPPIYSGGASTGISETNQGTDIDIYPNPTTDQLTITINDLSKIFDIRLFDLNGRLLYKTTSKNSEAKLSLGKYPNGTYIIKMTTADKMVTRKVVKTN